MTTSIKAKLYTKMVGQTNFNNCRVSKLKIQNINFVSLNKIILKLLQKVQNQKDNSNNFKFKWKIMSEQSQKKETK